MNFVLVISILVMCRISNRYYSVDYFENFWVDILVQLLHIVTLGFVLFMSIMHGSFLVWLFCIYGIHRLLDNICNFIMDIIEGFKPQEPSIDEENQEESDNDKEDR